MSRKIYHASLTSHVRQGWPILIYALLLPGVPLYVHYVHGIEDLRFTILVTAAFFLLILVPHLLIHLRYTFLSSAVSVEFIDQPQEIVVKFGDQTKVIHNVDIETVDLVIPRSLARKEVFVYPWQLYGYAIINLRSGEKVLITSLVVPRLKFPFKLQNVNIRESLYCWPP